MYLYVQNRNAALTRNGFSIHNFEEKFNIPLYIIPVLEFSIYGSTLSETKNEHLTWLAFWDILQLELKGAFTWFDN